MAEIKFSNYVRTVLTSAINDVQPTFDVIDASALPSIGVGDWFYLVLLRLQDGLKEIVKVTGVSSNTLTVVRAQDNTSARTFAQNDRVELWVTAATLEDLRTAYEAGDTSLSVSLGTVSSLVTTNASTIGTIQSDVSALEVSIASAGNMVYGGLKNSNFTAEAGKYYLCATATSPFTMVLPGSPTAGDRIGMINGDNSFDTNNLLVSRNGNNIMTSGSDLTVDENISFDLVYNDTGSAGWRLFL